MKDNTNDLKTKNRVYRSFTMDKSKFKKLLNEQEGQLGMEKLEKKEQVLNEMLGNQEALDATTRQDQAYRKAFNSVEYVGDPKGPRPSSDLFSVLKKKDFKKGSPKSIKDFKKQEDEEKEKSDKMIKQLQALGVLKDLKKQAKQEVKGLEDEELDLEDKVLASTLQDEDQEIPKYGDKATTCGLTCDETKQVLDQINTMVANLEDEENISKEEKEELRALGIKLKASDEEGSDEVVKALDNLLGEGFNIYAQEASLVTNAYLPQMVRGLRKI